MTKTQNTTSTAAKYAARYRKMSDAALERQAPMGGIAYQELWKEQQRRRTERQS